VIVPVFKRVRLKGQRWVRGGSEVGQKWVRSGSEVGQRFGGLEAGLEKSEKCIRDVC